ncbi:MAG: hypothetical protein E6713_15105 [Sporomusaceae bacterium]|nr:hypothetical protein [Sporomusaceae bacterium]
MFHHGGFFIWGIASAVIHVMIAGGFLYLLFSIAKSLKRIAAKMDKQE